MLDRRSGHVVDIACRSRQARPSVHGPVRGERVARAGRSDPVTGVRVPRIRCRIPVGVPGLRHRCRHVCALGRPEGVRAPRIVGSCTPEAVVKAVIRAIERNRLETMDNTPPLCVRRSCWGRSLPHCPVTAREARLSPHTRTRRRPAGRRQTRMNARQRPPVTSIAAPVTYEAASDASHTIASAISLRLAGALHRNRAAHPFDAAGRTPWSEVTGDQAGANGVDPDPVGGDLLGEPGGQRLEATLRGRVVIHSPVPPTPSRPPSTTLRSSPRCRRVTPPSVAPPRAHRGTHRSG